jgi:prepilin-type N-terminal cleavage/methylation domain-containing protein
MRNKKGFTVVELMLAIVLLLALAILVVPRLIDMGDSSKEKIYDSKIQLALNGAYKYGVDNIDNLSSSCTEVTIGALINLEYVSGDDESGYNLIDPDSGESMNNIVICVYYDKGEVRVSVK